MDRGTADGRLREECYNRLPQRYGDFSLNDAGRSLDSELDAINNLGLAEDFLAAARIHRYCLKRQIPWRLIGASCSSIVCYVLGLTDVDPLHGNLVFERFCDLDGRRPVRFTFQVSEDERERLVGFAVRMFEDEHVQDRFWFGIMPQLAVIPNSVLWLLQQREGLASGMDDDSGRVRHDDEATFANIAAGDTENVYLLDRPDLRRRLSDLAPQTIEGIAAIMALDLIAVDQPELVRVELREEVLARQFPEAIEGEDGRLLQETRGLVLYQEQIMLLLSAYGGIGLSEGYIFVREAAKRKQAVVERFRKRFLRQASEMLANADAEDLFERLTQAAGYACCKSHQMAEAATSFHAAYMKTHHPTEFREAFRLSKTNA